MNKTQHAHSIFGEIERLQHEKFNVEELLSGPVHKHWHCFLREVGEVADLTWKMDVKDIPLSQIKKEFESEFADLIIMITIMAMHLDVDLQSSIFNKIEVIKERRSDPNEKGRWGKMEKGSDEGD